MRAIPLALSLLSLLAVSCTKPQREQEPQRPLFASEWEDRAETSPPARQPVEPAEAQSAVGTTAHQAPDPEAPEAQSEARAILGDWSHYMSTYQDMLSGAEEEVSAHLLFKEDATFIYSWNTVVTGGRSDGRETSHPISRGTYRLHGDRLTLNWNNLYPVTATYAVTIADDTLTLIADGTNQSWFGFGNAVIWNSAGP
jgi:hypothetical protein